MLIGPDYVVANPTKTGTQSLVHLARSRPELGLEYVRPGHGMVPPKIYGNYIRHMVVRNPDERLLSIYHHLRRGRRDWGHHEASRMEYPEWVESFLDSRRGFDARFYDSNAPSIWLCTQAECWRILRGHFFWKLEEISSMLSFLGLEVGELPRLNVGNVEKVDLAPRIWDRVWREWSQEDSELFGYHGTSSSS